MNRELAQVLTDPTNLFTAFVALVCFVTFVTTAAPLMKSSGLEARLKSVANRREELRRRSREALANKASTGTLRQSDEGFYKRVVERLKLGKLLEDDSVADKLAQAGFRGPRPVSTYYFFRFVAPFVTGSAAAFYLFVVNGFNLPTMNR